MSVDEEIKVNLSKVLAKGKQQNLMKFLKRNEADTHLGIRFKAFLSFHLADVRSNLEVQRLELREETARTWRHPLVLSETARSTDDLQQER